MGEYERISTVADYGADLGSIRNQPTIDWMLRDDEGRFFRLRSVDRRVTFEEVYAGTVAPKSDPLAQSIYGGRDA